MEDEVDQAGMDEHDESAVAREHTRIYGQCGVKTDENRRLRSTSTNFAGLEKTLEPKIETAVIFLELRLIAVTELGRFEEVPV